MVIWLLLTGCDSGDYDGDGFSEPFDCDDGDAQTYPGAPEVPYDGKDQDCNGTDLDDQDGDGYQGEEAGGPDCNDFDPEVHPGAKEIPYDGRDQDCDRWSDDDADHDGFDAMGHGGDDCDDNNPLITPIDLDGDGYSPCTGDCDETDPRRNTSATPICGNGFDDDCDGVSDCASVGIIFGGTLPDRIVGSEAVAGFGTKLLAPGDLDGDGLTDVVIAGERDGLRYVWFMSPPVPTGSDESAAWGALTLPILDTVAAIGDVDGDGLTDLAVGGLDANSLPHLWVVTAPGPQTVAIDAVARLDLTGRNNDDVGSAVARLEERLAVGAEGLDEVSIVPLNTTGTQVFGGQGAILEGLFGSNAGGALLAHDTDGDGDLELFVAGSGAILGARPTVTRVVDVPTTGRHALADRADGTLDAREWGQSTTVMAAGDLNGDGQQDTVIAAPFANGSIGAMAILLEPLASDVIVNDVAVQRLGLGDDTFGWETLVQDLDGDGVDDLIAGAPAAWGGVGGAYKPGAVHVWYGPIAESVEHTFTADLLVEGATTTQRSFMGYGLAMVDMDGDGGRDLLMASPNFDQGMVEILPAGLTALLGF